MKTVKKIESLDYFDGLVQNLELWADKRNYNGETSYKQTAPLYEPADLKVKEDFSFKPIDKWIPEDGEKPCVYSIIHQHSRRYYCANMKASAHEFEALQDLGGIRLTASRDNVAVEIEVSDEGVLYFTVATVVLEKAGESQFVEFSEPSRRFIRLVCQPADPDDELDFYPHEIISAEVFSANSANQKKALVATVDNGIESPVLFPENFSDDGNEQIIPLSGIWKFTDCPDEKYWRTDTDVTDWKDIPVPGDLDHNGSEVLKTEREKSDKRSSGASSVYTQRIHIPADMEGKNIVLRFESAVVYSRVFVNGCFVCSHRGAMTPFDCDITDYVKPGMDAIITVLTVLERNFPDFAMVRGLAGYVWLIALPDTVPSVLRVTNDLDDAFNGLLYIREKLHYFKEKDNSEMVYKLYSPDGKEVDLQLIGTEDKGDGSVIKTYKVSAPELWSAETPRLYTLEAELVCDGKRVFRHIKKTGFKSVRVVGNRLYVNGKEEKLRGVNWMCLDPFNGLASNYESDRESLIKFKAANLNFIRTSHNPQKKYVHELCDELGIYVEEEAAVVFLSRWTPCSYEKFDFLVNPKFRSLFMEKYAQMMANAISHTSILYYSLGNESDWSDTVKVGREYMKAADPLKPHKFSWGWSHAVDAVEIMSEHYTNPQYMGEVSQTSVMYDEHSHTTGEIPEKIEQDPARRDFFSYRLKEIWENAYNKPGGLGIAIWNGRPFDGIKNGEHGVDFTRKWGELDFWNRAKPEYWIMRKMFSPVSIDESVTYRIPSHGNKLQIAVQNRYCQLDFSAIEMVCLLNGEEHPAKLPMLEPGEKGYISIVSEDWKAGDRVELYFYRNDDHIGNTILDQFEFIIEKPVQKLPYNIPTDDVMPSFYDIQVEAQINGGEMHFLFGRWDCTIHTAKFKGKTVIKEGPFLNLGTNFPLTFESSDSREIINEKDYVAISNIHRYKELDNPVKMIQKFYKNGKFEVTFSLTLPNGNMIDEVGVTYKLKNVVRQAWSKKSTIITSYPKEHVGRLVGDIPRNRPEGIEDKLTKPAWHWQDDECQFYLKDNPDFKSTRDFRASKNNYYYVAAIRDDGLGLAAVSNGHGGSVRFEIAENDDVLINVNSMFGYKIPGEFGAYYRAMPCESGEYTGTVSLQFFDLKG
ncbi:MAG: hypothetical protein IKD04_08245 [Clostridia bacterium]|nr:hypothetical protein [Clostridia bacterium]